MIIKYFNKYSVHVKDEYKIVILVYKSYMTFFKKKL